MKLYLCFYIKNNLILIVFIISYQLISFGKSRYLIMNFSSINFINNISYDFMSLIFNNAIYSNLSIGTPPQNLKVILSASEQTFYITKKTYNYSLSSTYKGGKNPEVFFLDNILSGSKGNDLATFNLISKNNLMTNSTLLEFAFVYSIKYNLEKKIDGKIGLQLKVPNYIGIPNFIDNLKKNKFINTYKWTLIYNTKDNNKCDNYWKKLLYKDSYGEFSIGFDEDEYNDIFHIELKDYEIKSVKAEKDKDKINWSLYFEDIYLIGKKVNKNNFISKEKDINRKYLHNKLADLLITNEYNIGTKEFEKLINEQFFNNYFEKDICYIKNIIYDYSYEKFFYYKCDNNTGKFFLENFPNIYFVHNDLNYTFELTYKDLFYTYINDTTKHIFYFNIVFSNSGRNKWSFGKPFLSKYLFIFEYDQKLIHLLRLKQSTNKKDNKKIITTIKLITIIILFIVLGSLIFFGGTLLGEKYVLYKKRKRKVANELEFEVFFDNNIN